MTANSARQRQSITCRNHKKVGFFAPSRLGGRVLGLAMGELCFKPRLDLSRSWHYQVSIAKIWHRVRVKKEIEPSIRDARVRRVPFHCLTLLLSALADQSLAYAHAGYMMDCDVHFASILSSYHIIMSNTICTRGVTAAILFFHHVDNILGVKFVVFVPSVKRNKSNQGLSVSMCCNEHFNAPNFMCVYSSSIPKKNVFMWLKVLTHYTWQQLYLQLVILHELYNMWMSIVKQTVILSGDKGQFSLTRVDLCLYATIH